MGMWMEPGVGIEMGHHGRDMVVGLVLWIDGMGDGAHLEKRLIRIITDMHTDTVTGVEAEPLMDKLEGL